MISALQRILTAGEILADTNVFKAAVEQLRKKNIITCYLLKSFVYLLCFAPL